MEKERFYYLKRRNFNSNGKTYYIVEVLDIIDCITVSIFTSKENYDYFNGTQIMDDISHLIVFHCNNNSSIYRPSIDRKE